MQADTYIFGTFNVQGPSNAPPWVVAGLALVSAGNYTGNDRTNTTAKMFEIKSTSLGIEGSASSPTRWRRVRGGLHYQRGVIGKLIVAS